MMLTQSRSQEFKNAVGKIMTRQRKYKHLTQAEVAAVAGVRQNTIYGYECGAGTPSLSVMLRIVQLLEIDFTELMWCLRFDRKERKIDRRLRESKVLAAGSKASSVALRKTSPFREAGTLDDSSA
jgi:transcriptional regulator with XRE-family HTH domain